MAECQSPLHCRVGEGDPLLKVRLGSGIFAQVEQGAPKRIMSL
jgi:hypothetical protein